MSLQEIEIDTEEAVDAKNVLGFIDSPISIKYVTAGRIAQSVLAYLVKEITEQRLSNVYDICSAGDALIEQETNKIFKNVDEKGVAAPTTVDINNCVSGYSPIDRDSSYVLNNGDLAKISLGVHIDGYTSLVSHTLIALPTIPLQDQVAPATGPIADLVCATSLAKEAVISLLGSILQRYDNQSGYYHDKPITGERIRDVVESVAKSFKVKIVPGSTVRRIKRFLVGQNTVHEVDVKGYTWGSLSIDSMADDKDEGDLKKIVDSESIVEAGEAWLIDITMCSYTGLESDLSKHNPVQVSRRTVKPHKDLKTTIFTRDYNVTLSMKARSSRGVLTEIDNRKSVFPIHLNSLLTPGAPLGVAALAKSQILYPTSVMMILGSPAPIAARERATILLMPSNKRDEVVYLSGDLKPSWVHSDFEIVDEEIAELLSEQRAGVKIRNIKETPMALDKKNETDAMEIE
ncbi:peptidase M24, structural domain-containing protein [Lipomyces arxii]|uniref:peptidase M24, structural domain-containing protein n=1 Tax=Lipomyces arxii TaxID=56418 RepID=UPI0034CF4E69